MRNKKIIKKIFHKNFKNLKTSVLVNNDSITNKVSLSKPSIYIYEIEFDNNTRITFVGKWKSKKIIINGISLISNKDIKIATLLTKNHKIFGYNKSYIREILFYKNINSDLKKYLINTRGFYCNNLTDTYFIAMDYITDSEKIVKKDYKKILDTITDFHKTYYNQKTSVKELCLNYYEIDDYKKCKKVMLQMFNKLNNKKFFNTNKILKINNFIKNIDNEYKQVLFHQTLTHNDFSPRNMFLNNDKVYVYDWELACYQNPEHDLIEFLVFVLHELKDNEIKNLIEYFKKNLCEKLDMEIDNDTYKKIIDFNVLEYVVNRLTLLRMANNKLKLPFIDQMTININRLIEILKI